MLGQLADLGTRKFWRATGRPVDLAGEHTWLRAPTSTGPVVRDGWLEAEAALHDGYVDDATPGAGLLASMAGLDGPGFRAADLLPQVRDFYEHTSNGRIGSASCSTRRPKRRETSSPPGHAHGAHELQTSTCQSDVCS